jgi:hypothetical protein
VRAAAHRRGGHQQEHDRVARRLERQGQEALARRGLRGVAAVLQPLAVHVRPAHAGREVAADGERERGQPAAAAQIVVVARRVQRGQLLQPQPQRSRRGLGAAADAAVGRGGAYARGAAGEAVGRAAR